MTEKEWESLKRAKGNSGPIKKMPYRTRKLLAKTEKEDEHPDDYNGPCFCRTCMSYADT